MAPHIALESHRPEARDDRLFGAALSIGFAVLFIAVCAALLYWWFV